MWKSINRSFKEAIEKKNDFCCPLKEIKKNFCPVLILQNNELIPVSKQNRKNYDYFEQQKLFTELIRAISYSTAIFFGWYTNQFLLLHCNNRKHHCLEFETKENISLKNKLIPPVFAQPKRLNQNFYQNKFFGIKDNNLNFKIKEIDKDEPESDENDKQNLINVIDFKQAYFGIEKIKNFKDQQQRNLKISTSTEHFNESNLIKNFDLKDLTKQTEISSRFNPNLIKSINFTKDESFNSLDEKADSCEDSFDKYFESFSKSSSKNDSFSIEFKNDTTDDSNDLSSINDISSTNDKSYEAIDKFMSEENIERLTGVIENQIGSNLAEENNFKKSIDCFKSGVKHKNPSAAFNLGLCYELGRGTKQDFNKAAEYYRIAAELGHPKAMYNLGVYHAQGRGSLQIDFDKAEEYFTRAADLGNKESIDALLSRNCEIKILNNLKHFSVY